MAKSSGDDKLHQFLTEQYQQDRDGLIRQNANIQAARIAAICRRRGKDFYEDVTEPDTEPWFLLEVTTSYVRSGGYGRSSGNWTVLLATDGEAYFPVKYMQHTYRDPKYYSGQSAGTTVGKFTTTDPRTFRQGYDPTLPLARVCLSYGSVDLKSFGPSDKELIQRAIANYGRAPAPAATA